MKGTAYPFLYRRLALFSLAIAAGLVASLSHADSSFTSHFNFDNREDGENTVKRRCYVDLEVLNGAGSATHIVKRGFGHPSPTEGLYLHLRQVQPGTFKVCQVDRDHLRAVAVRFHWFEKEHSCQSQWIRATDGHILEYVFLVWKDGDCKYEISEKAETEINGGGSYGNREETGEAPESSEKGIVRMYFVHDYSFNTPVRVYLTGPYSPASFVLAAGQMVGVDHVDDGKLRALSAFRTDNGTLVTLQAYEPQSVCWLLNESICGQKKLQTEVRADDVEETAVAAEGDAH